MKFTSRPGATAYSSNPPPQQFILNSAKKRPPSFEVYPRLSDSHTLYIISRLPSLILQHPSNLPIPPIRIHKPEPLLPRHRHHGHHLANYDDMIPHPHQPALGRVAQHPAPQREQHALAPQHALLVARHGLQSLQDMAPQVPPRKVRRDRCARGVAG
ncbi:hypothetical protein AK830_g10693 [Neonectria ditissima]|uniref:Uncharacterized protein n=1 Tax=Neonectria ditissima TaxID=78410 RepID=A0A0P7APB7_9HYPO|nr:hypothetical protein AK830_g10693 [Neonectria ditissima]